MSDFALELNNGSFMAAANIAAYNLGTGDFTLEAWFKTTGPGTIISRKPTAGGAGAGGFLLVVKPGGVFKLATDSGFGFYEVNSEATEALDGTWHHVAGIRKSGQLSIYFDGRQLNSVVGNNTSTPCDINNNLRLVIGFADQQQEPFRNFTGMLDEVRLWNISRSAEQIANNMDGRLSGLETGLIGYWNFNGENGADGSPTKNDSIAQGNVGYKTPGAPTSRVATISNGLVAYYPLISDAKDYSGNGHDATANSGVSFGAGLHGGSVTLTGAAASVDLPLNFQRYADHYTISAWVCLNASAQAPDSNQGTIAGRLGFLRSNGTLMFYFYFDGPNSADNQLITIQSTTGISANEWHHVAVTYNHDSSKLGFYIDRELDSIHDISAQVSRNDRPQFPSYKTIGGSNGVVGVLNGSISDVFLLDITCEKDDINFLGGIMTPQAEENDSSSRHMQVQAVQKRGTAADCSPSWWAVIPVIGWIALQQAANCAAQPVYAPMTPSEITSTFYTFLKLSPGTPIPAGQTVSRSQIGVPNSVRIHVDIGGEGPIDSHGIRTGFDDALNLQAADGGIGDGSKQTQPPYGPIPNLIRMKSWSQAYPFGDKFADYVTMQNAPLTDVNVEQIARIIKPTGEIAFWIGLSDIGERNGNKTNQSQVQRLATLLKARVVYHDTDEFNGKAGNEKTTLVLQYGKDEL